VESKALSSILINPAEFQLLEFSRDYFFDKKATPFSGEATSK